MGDVQRLRGHRTAEMYQRANAVVSGQSSMERNPAVLSLAADILLEPYLKAARVENKGDILSYRQIMRRKSREVSLGDGINTIDLRRFSTYKSRVPHYTLLDSEE